MSGNFKNDNLIAVKTYTSIVAALEKLLNNHNFGRLTVNELCEEAQISRFTFYIHFKDKYDVLKNWLTNVRPENIYEDNNMFTEQVFNKFINDKSNVISNLIEDADNKTLELLQDFIVSILKITEEENEEGKAKYIVMSNFCAGGIINFIRWNIKNVFPYDLQKTNVYFYDFLSYLLKWEK